MMVNAKLLLLARYGSAISLLLLVWLCLGWELWWAPLRPGGSWLALKALLLLLPLRGLLPGRRYTAQWASMFILFWLTEGLVRAWSDRGLSQWLAGFEAALSLICFAFLLAYARLSGRMQQRLLTLVG